MTIWQPMLSGQSGPKFRQISDAIRESVADGRLPVGARLPPQRDLAYALGVSLNTVSRAYADATDRGYVAGEVGRGTYVRAVRAAPPTLKLNDLTRPSTGPIDFSRNLPCPSHADRVLARTLGELSQSSTLGSLLDYQLKGDQDHHRVAAAAWLGRTGLTIDADNIVFTSGAQHGIMVALLATTGPSDIVLTDELTYAPIKVMAHHLGLRIVPVASECGLLSPGALDDVCEQVASRVLYSLPTLHTPTTATMSSPHRKAIAEVARKRGLTIIEDDVFGFLPPERPPPLAEFAPERTIYLTSVSKSLAPGLRIGYIQAPLDKVQAIRSAVNLSNWMPPPLMVEIATRWIEDGTADELNQFQRGEAAARQSMARDILPDSMLNTDPHGFHAWLRLPEDLPADGLRMAAHERGVEIMMGSAFAVSRSVSPNAVRLSLSYEHDLARVEKGLTILADILRNGGESGSVIL